MYNDVFYHFQKILSYVIMVFQKLKNILIQYECRAFVWTARIAWIWFIFSST